MTSASDPQGSISCVLLVGVGRVSFSALGSGFGFLDFARVGFRVKEIWFGSSSGHFFFCIFQSILAVFGKKLAIFLKKNYFGLLGFLKKLLGSGRVGQKGLGSGQISGRVLTRPIPRIASSTHLSKNGGRLASDKTILGNI